MTDTIRLPEPRMPSIGRLLSAQIGYQARLLASGRAITIGIGLPVILLIASHQSHTQTTDADVAGYAVFGLTLTAWNTYGVRLVAAREAGVLKRWRATPLPRWCYFLGRILATVAVATVAGAATVAAGVLLYNTHLTVSAALAALAAFVLGSLAWAAAATALTAVIPTLESAAPTFLVTYFPVIIISGVFGAISEPHWLSTIASYLPAQPLARTPSVSRSGTPPATWLPPPATSPPYSQPGRSPGSRPRPSYISAGSRTGPPSDAHGRTLTPVQAADPGTWSSRSDSSASTAATTTPMPFGAATSTMADTDGSRLSQPVVRLLAGRWTLAVLGELAHGGRRYQDLRTARGRISHTKRPHRYPPGLPSAMAWSSAMSTAAGSRPPPFTNSPTLPAPSRTPLRTLACWSEHNWADVETARRSWDERTVNEH